MAEALPFFARRNDRLMGAAISLDIPQVKDSPLFTRKESDEQYHLTKTHLGGILKI